VVVDLLYLVPVVVQHKAKVMTDQVQFLVHLLQLVVVEAVVLRVDLTKLDDLVVQVVVVEVEVVQEEMQEEQVILLQ
jgi:hypothetical protein